MELAWVSYSEGKWTARVSKMERALAPESGVLVPTATMFLHGLVHLAGVLSCARFRVSSDPAEAGSRSENAAF